jgi:uncharacterized protein (TIGR02646 family)
MLRLPDQALSNATEETLDILQVLVDAGANFTAQAELAKSWWKKKTGTKVRESAFNEVRARLATMLFGSIRCAYCKDSAADEIEHIAPKTVFPSRAFRWNNYCFACGPCNGPKGDRFATVTDAGVLDEADPETLTAEPNGQAALIDPRHEDPTRFLELDIGGVTADGLILTATSNVLVRDGLDLVSRARAQWTIDVLRLNREVLRKARETAYQSYRAALSEYARAKTDSQPRPVLDALRDGILAMPHPTVLNEMIRQSSAQPVVRAAIEAAPEIAVWLR